MQQRVLRHGGGSRCTRATCAAGSVPHPCSRVAARGLFSEERGAGERRLSHTTVHPADPKGRCRWTGSTAPGGPGRPRSPASGSYPPDHPLLEPHTIPRPPRGPRPTTKSASRETLDGDRRAGGEGSREVPLSSLSLGPARRCPPNLEALDAAFALVHPQVTGTWASNRHLQDGLTSA